MRPTDLFRPSRIHFPALALSLVLVLSFSASAQVKAVAPSGGMWSAGDGFAFKNKAKKTRQSLSGVACAPTAQGQRICLMAFDEGVTMQFAELLPDGAYALRPLDQPLVLGRAGDELDAEAAATDGAYFYVTGSHAVKRKDCAPNPASQHVLRFRRDAATGLAAQPPALQDLGRLAALVAALPAFQPYAGTGHCLGTGALDIEGLAVRRGRLWFGLRGPTEPAEPGTAFIVSVDTEAFFGGGDAKARAYRVTLGPGRGLRDMVAVQDGILLLAGPDDAERNQAVPWLVLHWDDNAEGQALATPRPLAQLDLAGVALRQCDKEIKPEAMTVLAQTPAAYRLLVLSDGLCDGGALAFDIPR